MLIGGSPGNKKLEYGYLTDDIDAIDFGDLDRAEFEKCRCQDPAGRTAIALEDFYYYQYGSGKGKGKACSESRVFFLLTNLEDFPIYLSVGAGSYPAIEKKLSGIGRKQRIDYRSLAYTFGLEKVANATGTDYAKVTFETAKEDGKPIRLSQDQTNEIANKFGGPIDSLLTRSLHLNGESEIDNDGGLED